jgi:hypothetical protein
MGVSIKTGLAIVAMWGVLAPTALAEAVTRPTWQPVPASDRLTLAGVVGDASVEVQLMMAVMTLATLAALGVWGASLPKVGVGDARALAAGLGRLRIVRSGGVMLGLLTAAYVVFAMWLGTANVRPEPDLTLLAPGFAEATLALMLGLAASTVAVICGRHLEGRIRTAAA